MSGDVRVQCSTNRTYLPSHKGHKLFLKIEIIPHEEMHDSSLPITVCLLIDRSGSMAGTKLKNAKVGALNLIHHLTGSDNVGLVTFETHVDVVIPVQRATELERYESAIKNIGLGETTELYRGLETAHAELKKSMDTTHKTPQEIVQRIILLSDGIPTDENPPSSYRMLARSLSEEGISITALGIGEDYNEDLLSLIAENSGGAWYHITSPDSIPDIFSRELTNMKTVIISRPELILHLTPDVELDDVHKSKPLVHRISHIIEDGAVLRIPLGDIRAGETQTIVARLAIPPRPEGQCRIATVSVISGVVSHSEDVVVTYTSNESLWDETDPYSRTLFAVTETQIKARDGLSGDKTALKEAQSQLQTILKDPQATSIKDIADRTVLIEDILKKPPTRMSRKEKKIAKSELTRMKR
jgi:Ca-activated chloride channel family protein